MATSQINQVYLNALLADAAYVDWNSPGDPQFAAALRVRMTPTVADFVLEHFDVVTQERGPAGFDVTVFRNKETNKLVVAMRGTAGMADIYTDLKLAYSGNARQQLTSMVNWWLRATTPVREMVAQYGVDWKPLPLPHFSFETVEPAAGTGKIKASDLAAGTEVVGHSLGGYLATAFGRVLGKHAKVTDISTYNSAGFAKGSESAFERLEELIGIELGYQKFPSQTSTTPRQRNFYAMNGMNFTTNDAWFNQAGSRHPVYNEYSSEYLVPFPNHFQYKLTDALTIGEALGKLDTTFDIARMNELFEKGADTKIASLEGIVDALRRALLSNGEAIVRSGASDAGDSPPERVQMHLYLKELSDSTYFGMLKDSVRITTPSAGLIDRNDSGGYFANLLALRTLSPFVLMPKDVTGIGALEQANKTLAEDVAEDRIDTAEKALDGSLNFSDSYLKDRAAMLSWIIKKNKDDLEYLDGPSVQLFVDKLTGMEVTVGLPAAVQNPDQLRHFLFGDKRDDQLAGGAKNDHLFGDRGDDKLSGMGGNDVIEGNLGKDVLEGGDGHDKLLGGLGDDNLVGGKGFDLLQGGADNDLLQGGADNDALYGGAGNDTLEGEADNDFLYGGDGSDTLSGGTGNDYLYDDGMSKQGAAEASTMDGDDGNDVLEGGAGKGETVFKGGAGNDVLIGGAGVNTLEGGAGNDLITGSTGGGSDTLVGDAGADNITGNKGADTLNGGAGSDFMRGETGDDTYLYDDANFGTDLISDDTGSDAIKMYGQKFGGGGYDAITMSWTSNNGYEIRKYKLGEMTNLAISKSGNANSTIFIHNWTAGQFGITLSGEEEAAEKPSMAGSPTPTRAENNYVDFVRNDAGDGGQGNDIVRGTDAQSSLAGGDGNDILDGRGGDDWLEGGIGNDIILTGTGKDVAYGGAGNDVIRAGYNFDMVNGVFVDGGAPAVFYAKGAGYDDWLKSDGNAARQFYYYQELPDGSKVKKEIAHPELAAFDIKFERELEVNPTYTGYMYWYNTGEESVSLEPSLKITLSLGDNEKVTFGATMAPKDEPSANLGKAKSYGLVLGNYKDVLEAQNGGQGARLWGGIGDDVIYGAHNSDKLYGEADDDLLVGYGGDDELYGGAGKDELSGGAGRDFLDGGVENDQLQGGYGADMLYGGDGDDNLLGDAGYLKGTTWYPAGTETAKMGGDYLDGGIGNDMLWGNHGDDHLRGGTGNDKVYGGYDDDHLWGEDGQDTLFGGKGGDYLAGDGEADFLIGEEGDDILRGGEGDDNLDGGENNDIVEGGENNDVLTGGDGADILRGGDGNDALYGDNGAGSDGADILDGGKGNDTLNGGGKSDIFVFAIGDGQDVLQENGADGSRNTVALKFSQKHVREVRASGLDLVIDYGLSDSLTVKGFYVNVPGGNNKQGDGPDMVDQGAPQSHIAEITFSDGTSWGLDEILEMAPAPEPGETPDDPFAELAPLYFINALLSREETRAAGKNALTFSFATAFQSGENVCMLFSEENKSAVRSALARFSAVLDLTFTEVDHAAGADLSFQLDDLTSVDMGAFAGYADASTGKIHLNSTRYGLKFTDEFGEAASRDSLQVGADGFVTLLHEIAHTLGLKHPFEAPLLPKAENNSANTVMSYTRSGEPVTDLALFDVAALQYLYGVAEGRNSGSNTYSFADHYIGDAGGTDTFDASAESADLAITLEAGQWLHSGARHESILAQGQTFIGFGTLIENARGGSGHDKLVGNSAANMLEGGLGDDTLTGAAGNDTLLGGAGADSYLFAQGSGADRIIESERDTRIVIAGVSTNDLYYKDGAIWFSNNGDRIEVDLSLVAQIVVGDAVYSGAQVYAALDTVLSEAGDLVLADGQTRARLLGTQDLRISGNHLANVLTGNSGNNVLRGDAGDDALLGGLGDDALYGGEGNDLLASQGGADLLEGGAGDDTYVVESGAALILDGAGVNLLRLAEASVDLRAQIGSVESGVSINLNDYADASAFAGSANSLLADAAGLVAGPYTDIAGANSRALVRGGLDANIDMLEDSHGNRLAWAQLVQQARSERYDTVHAEINRRWYGSDYGDQLTASQAGYTFVGGQGDDRLSATGGGNTFLFAKGDGHDLITVADGGAGVAGNTLRFGPGITASDVKLGASGALEIRFGDDGQDSIRIEGFDRNDVHGMLSIDRFAFVDGTVLSYAQLLDVGFDLQGQYDAEHINGTNVVDRIRGGGGDDTLAGGAGGDIYSFGLGDGADWIREAAAGSGADVLKLTGLGPKDVRVWKGLNDIWLTFEGDGLTLDSVVLEGQLSGNGTGVERVEFSDGTVWTAQQLFERAIEGAMAPVRVQGSDGDDILKGLDGDDTVVGMFGNDVVTGGDGNDYLTGAYEYDEMWSGDNGGGNGAGGFGPMIVIGGDEGGGGNQGTPFADDDTIHGGAGDDTLDGGYRSDRDTLRGESGNDFYIFRAGSGADTIIESGDVGNNDSIRFEYMSRADVRFTRTLQDLRISSVSGSDTLVVKDYFARDDARLEWFSFDFGGALSAAELMLDMLSGSEQDDLLFGYAGADALEGNGGNDTIAGLDGDDTLSGGAGNDVLDGGAGSDTYVFNAGDGRDLVADSGSAADTDTIRLGEGIAPADVVVTRNDAGLVLYMRASGERIGIAGWFSGTGPSIEQLLFDDGTVWSAAMLTQMAGLVPAASEGDDFIGATAGADLLAGLGGNDELHGLAGNDTLDGGSGDDLLAGGAGDDTYLYALGEGSDTIADNGDSDFDVLVLGAAIAPTDVRVTRNAESLLIELASGQVLTLENWFTREANRLAEVRFADGTVWSALALEALSAIATNLNDYLVGTDGADSLAAMAGDDAIVAGQGADTLSGGLGSDQLDGGAGDDVYLFQAGDGADAVTDAAGFDRLVFGAGMAPRDIQVFRAEDGSLLLQRYASGDRIAISATRSANGAMVADIEQIEFADGTVWSAQKIAGYALDVPTARYDFIIGSARGDVLDGLGGGDSIEGREGADRYIFKTGYGALHISDNDADTANLDTIELGAGIGPDDIVVRRQDNSLVLQIGANGDIITVHNHFAWDGYRIELVQFADGSVWNGADIDARQVVQDGTDERETIYGSGRGDVIDGRAGDDELYGLAGGDRIDGGSGADNVMGGDGADTLSGGANSNIDMDWEKRFDSNGYSWFGAGKTDVLYGGSGDDTFLIDAASGFDLIHDHEGNDKVVLGAGLSVADLIISDGTPWGHSGETRVDFGSGAFFIGAATRIERIESLDGLFVTREQFDAYRVVRSYGGSGADRIEGTAGPDEIDSGDGDDTVYGGTGRDVLRGSYGNDVLSGQDGGDTIEDGTGDNLLLGGAGDDQISGTGYLSGGAGNDIMHSYAGVLDGGAGDDTLQLRDGASVIFGRGAGHDRIHSDALYWIVLDAGLTAADLAFDGALLDAVKAPLTLRIRDSGDSLAGIHSALGVRFADGSTLSASQIAQLVQAPALLATQGDDILIGTAAGERIDGMAGRDEIAGGAGDDTLVGAAGDDRLRGGEGDDLLEGGIGSDNLDGGAGSDLLLGGAARDELYGALGDDTLVGGAGDDLLDGGAGINTYRFNRGDGNDNIFSYTSVTDAPLLIIELGAGIAAADLAVQRVSGSVLLTIADGGGSLALSGWLDQASVQQLLVRFADGTEWNEEKVLSLIGVDPYIGDFRDNVLSGVSARDEYFQGRGGNDRIEGGAGRDIIEGGGGNDTLDGGVGNDQLYGSHGADLLYGGDGTDTLNGDDGDDLLSGGAGADTLAGAQGNDTLDGGAGNDQIGTFDVYGTIDASTASDTILFGYGDGNDTLNADRFDLIQLGAGITIADIDIVADRDNLIIRLKSSGDSITVPAWGRQEERIGKLRFADGRVLSLAQRPAGPIFGTEYANQIGDSNNASPYDDDFFALDGNDVVYGGSGNDRLHGGAGNDVLYGEEGENFLDGGAGSDQYLLAGYSKDTLLFGFDSGADTFRSIYGDYVPPKAIRFENNVTQNDVVIKDLWLYAGGTGSFRIGLKGSDATLGTFKLQTDADGSVVLQTSFVFGDGSVVSGADLLDTFYRGAQSAGDDTLLGGADDDFLNGLAGDDVLAGGDGDDVLNGGAGDDTFLGGRGNDTIVAGAGYDIIDGGLGRNTYRFDRNSGVDFIERSRGQDEDVIEFGADILPDDIAVSIKYGTLTFSIAGSGTEVGVDGGWWSGYGDSASRMTIGELRFANGTVWTAADVARRLQQANDNANTLQGTYHDDQLAGLAGNDVIHGAAGADVLWGDDGDDTLNGGQGLDRLMGGKGNDLLAGGDGNDALDGGAGNDTLSGAAGSDRYSFGSGGGHDFVSDFGSAPSDVDTLQFGPGITLADISREMIDGQLVLSINGGADSITISGFSQALVGIERLRFADGTIVDPLTWQVRERAVSLTQGSGMQTVAAGSIVDTLAFGAGITAASLHFERDGQDLVVASGADGVRFAGWFDDNVTQQVLQARFADGTVWSADELTRHAFTLDGTAGDDVLATPADVAASLSGRAGNDRLRGGHGDDLLDGGAGNDTLDGGLGADLMVGGAGDDLYVVDNGGDVVLELADGGSDTIRMLALADIVVSGEIENYEALGAAAINMTGNALANRLLGTSGANRLEGGAGNDILDGGAGADILAGGTGDDILVVDNAADTVIEVAGEGSDTVHASISYTVQAGSNIEHITLLGAANLNAGGDAAANRLTGNSGRNVLRGMDGADLLDGGAAADALFGGAGDDVYVVDDAGDTVIEVAGEGVELVLASVSHTLADNVEHLQLTGSLAISGGGNALANKLTGNAAANVLSGGAGNDELDGAAGNDFLGGDAGDDVYHFGRGSGQDAVHDNSAASSGDTIRFGAGVGSGDLLLRWNGNDLVVSIRDTSDRLTLKNYRSASGAIETFQFAAESAWDMARIIGEADSAAPNTNPFLAAAQGDLQTDVGSVFSLSVGPVFGDADAGDVLVVAATLANGDPLPRWLSYNAATRTFSGTPHEGDTGTVAIRISASDSANRVLSDEFNLSVRNQNDTSPVVAQALPDQTTRQDAAFAYTVAPASFIDADPGDTLSYSALLASGQPLPRWLKFDAARQAFVGTPGKDDVGSLAVSVTARDTRGRSASSVFSLTIDDINDPPRIVHLVADQLISQGQSVDVTIAADMFADREGDAVSVSLTLANGDPLPGWLSFDAATLRLTGTSGPDAVGITTVRVRGTDSNGASAADEFEIVVADVNDAPRVANPLGKQIAREGQPFSFKIPASLFADPDRGDSLSYRIERLDAPEHARSDVMFNAASATLSLKRSYYQFQYSDLDYWDVGSWTFKITARDALGAEAAHTFEVEVQSAAINHIPVAAPTATPWLTGSYSIEGGMVQWTNFDKPAVVSSMASSFTVAIPTFADVDGDVLTYDVVPTGGADAANWRYDAQAGSMRFTGQGAAPRRVSFDIIATDTSGASSKVRREIVANSAPTIGEIADIVLRENQAFSIRLPASAFADADGDTVRVASQDLYSYNPLTGYREYWGVLEGSTMLFKGEPGDFAVGTHYLKVVASDAFSDGYAEPDGAAGRWIPNPSQFIKVVVLNEYDAPILSRALADLTVLEDENVSIDIAGAFRELDPGEVLSYSAVLANGQALPAWLSIDARNGRLQGLPLTDHVGNYAITVSATDRFGGSASDQFDLNVQLAPRNHAPKLMVALADQIYKRGQSFSFQVPRESFIDVDAGDVLTYSARQGNGNALPSWIVFDASSLTFSGLVPADQRAPTEITLIAADQDGLQQSDEFSIGIDEKTAPPVVLRPLANQAANEDQPFSFVVPADAFGDVEPSSALSFSATLVNGAPLPAWLRFDAASATFSGTPANGQVGVIQVRVSASEADSGSVSDVFELQVFNTNDAPEVSSSSVMATRNRVLTLSAASLLAQANDVDPTGDVLSVVAVGAASNGSVVLQADGSVLFTPDPDFVGGASFVYSVADGKGGQASATVSIDVRAVVNAAPTALDAQLDVAEDGAVVLGVANFPFSDPDGDLLLSVTLTAPAAGRLLLDGVLVTASVTVSREQLDAGKLVFSPPPDASGIDVAVRFSVNDGQASVNQATLSISVTALNDAPTAASDAASVAEDDAQVASGNVLVNDSDADLADVLGVVNPGVFSGIYGTLTLALDGSYRYVLDNAAAQSLAGGALAADTFNYAATDGAAQAASTLVVSITGANDAPLALADAAAVAEDRIMTVSGNVLANDRDADAGAVLRVDAPGTLAGAFGVLTLGADGTYTYVLDNAAAAVQALAAGQTLVDRFAYRATDGITSAGATLDIAIEGSADVPVTSDDVARVQEDSVLIGTGNVLDNDQDGDGAGLLRVAAPGVYAGRFGTLTLAGDGSYSYQLDNGAIAVQSLAAGASLIDRFTYVATDGISNTEASLRVMIAGSNDAPVTTDDGYNVHEDGQLRATGMLLANDYDVDNGAVLAIRAPGTLAGAHGMLSVDANGSYTYLLNNDAATVQALGAGETATDTFSYVATDGIADTAASLVISVTGKNDGPVTSNDTAAVQEDKLVLASGNVLTNDSDVDYASVLSVLDAGVLQGQYGTLTMRENGSYSYALNNGSAPVQSLRAGQVAREEFSYAAFDGIDASTGTLAIEVSGSNDGPVALDDAAGIIEDQTAPVTGNVLGNDTDADAGTLLRVVNAGSLAGAYGRLTLGADGAYSYALDNTLQSVQALAAGQVVGDSFAYIVKDDDAGAALTDDATLRIAVTGRNDAPVVARALVDKQFASGTQFSYQLDSAAFQDADRGDALTYGATLVDGKPLPAWLLFNAATRTFSAANGTVAGVTLAVRVAATDLSGASVFDDFTLTVEAVIGGLVINGTRNNDKLVGTAFNDIIDGREGRDTMTGGKGDDIYYVDDQQEEHCGDDGHHDNGNHKSDTRYGGRNRRENFEERSDRWNSRTVDVVLEKIDEGYDTVYSTASYTLASNVEQLRLLGYDDLDGKGNALNNALFGNAGANLLDGAAGTDVLHGGAGNDTLTDTLGNNLLDGGAGDDDVIGGAGREFTVGGAGDDWIVTGSGADVIAFNRGDGRDTVAASSGKDNTLSLGNGITYADLRFAKSKKDLILITGSNEQITFQDWYANGGNRSIANLQVVIEGTADYNPQSTNKLNNRKVEQFNFDGLVAKFDAAMAANSKLTSWGLSASLLNFHLGGSDTAALGGDLAYQYATKDSLAGIPAALAQSILNAADYGVGKQSVQASPLTPQLLQGVL